jgi:hypothetical protein
VSEIVTTSDAEPNPSLLLSLSKQQRTSLAELS